MGGSRTMGMLTRNGMILAAVGVVLLPVSLAPGQAKEPSSPDVEQPASQPEEPGLPDLDELLGLGGESGEDAADPSRTELDRVLSGAEIGDAFVQAVGLMGDVAGRLETERDTGLVTQRLQEDVIRRLDQLIESIRQQQQQSSSSSSSSSRRSSQQQPQQQPDQAQGQQPPGGGESSEHAEAPPLQEGQLRPDLEAVTSKWGELPDRVRAMLLQGVSDRFSAHYQRMTEAYYRRLAEQAGENGR